ncbi:hypothetical protein [Mycobacteroides abscessus]|uniref:hypothetical protein n=1 Tax=Mycobacteroides abscessus TaxID=36809 RepID=UPI0002586101|nr:hypothetical protein [Mycobacteroides abscessus]EIC63633.1 hypothetical protein OUW_20656 [Mycobacteroides abscessus M93]
MTSEPQPVMITQDDLRGAWARCNLLPVRYETPGDQVKVQWAARKAIEALTRLNIEILIAEERRQIGVNERQAMGHRVTLRGLVKLRVKRD